MYSSYFGQELARARINDQLAQAEAHRLAAAARRARPARPRRQRTSIPTVLRLLQLSPLTRRPAT
jgi:hypothetical protein